MNTKEPSPNRDARESEHLAFSHWRKDRELAQEVWKKFAGSVYDDLMRKKEIALAHLFDPNPTVRKAAIGICDIHWNCSSDMGFINACRELAGSDPDQSVRADAIRSLGKALESSRDPSASHFLANVVKDGDKSQEERAAAYWALREIHLGLTEQDNVKRSISLMKLALPRLEMGMTEEEVKQTLLGRGQFAYIDWDSVDLIDWDFVNQFVSSK